MAALALAAILVFPVQVSALEVSAVSAVLMDSDSGSVLWGKNARRELPMASTTKIMTALVVLENAPLGELVQVDPRAVGIEGSSMYLKAGEQLTVEELLCGLMLSSGNDAAAALAIHVCGSIEGFASLMNQKARELDLKNTHYVNPHGLDDPNQYSSALDLAKLAAAAMENPDFKRIVSQKSCQVGERHLINHNKLLWNYPGALGVKTGYTKRAGRILVGAAEQGGRTLISVTMGAPDDWNDHARMLDAGFSRYEDRILLEAGQVLGTVPVISGTAQQVSASASEELHYSMREDETFEVRLLTPAFVYAPVERGMAIGTAQIYVNQKLVRQCGVFAGASVPEQVPEPGVFRKIFGKAGTVS